MITDKHVLITGGGTGIGRAMQELFAKKVQGNNYRSQI